MTPFRKTAILAALLLVQILSLAAHPPKSKDTSRWMLNADSFTSAEICAGCHKSIHAGWSESLHGRSFSDPVFAEAFELVRGGSRASEAKECLSCHAPTTLMTGDTSAKDPLTREGITCSFCHSISSAADRWALDAFKIEPGQTMRGPYQFASSPAHDTLYSPLHRTARICAPCHELRSEAGLAILDTYEEWKAGPWPAQGVQCQDCHMALVPGAVADQIAKPALAAGQDKRLINLHRLVGGSSVGQLRRALTARIVETRRTEGTIRAVVQVTNDAAGHKAPTGLPSRSIVLRLEATSGGKTFFGDDRVYKRELLDAEGKRILDDGRIFLDAAKIGSDTRLGPGETRAEIFSFPAPPGEAKLVVSLDYVISRGPGVTPERRRFQEVFAEAK